MVQPSVGIKGPTRPVVVAGNNQSINQLINGAIEQSSNRAINQSSNQSSNQLIAQESSQSIINPLTIKCGVTKGRKAKPSCLSINNHIHRS
jgi:2-hydroxy-3-keto-5-methylthiopentenyl-1-phosphate phosphatase